jgi:hypothetical protein
MEIVADDQQLADKLHGDLAIEFVVVAEFHFIGGGFGVVIELAGMGAAARTPWPARWQARLPLSISRCG